MATTNTVSSSNASTFVRMLALKNQFKIAFQRIMDYRILEYAPFLDAISDKMIKRIDFWAYKKNSAGEREKWCQLSMYIDWEKHKSFIVGGNNEVHMKKSWNGILPEVGTAVDMFEELVSEFDLTATFSVFFVDNISPNDYNHYMKKLGLGHGKDVKWKQNTDISILSSLVNVSPKELEELGLELLISERI